MSIQSNGFTVKIVVLSDGKSHTQPKLPNSNVVPLKHGQEYGVYLYNSNKEPCDAELFIDTVNMGKFRVPGLRGVTIERPQNIAQKFTFYEEGTAEAKESQIKSGVPTNGNVRVVFLPGKKRTGMMWSITGEWVEVPDDYPKPHWHQSGMRRTDDGGRYSSDGLPYVNQGRTVQMMNQSATLSSNNLEISNSVTDSLTDGFGSGGTGLGAASDQSFHVARNIEYDYSRKTTIDLRLVVGEYTPKIRPLKDVRSEPVQTVRQPFTGSGRYGPGRYHEVYMD